MSVIITVSITEQQKAFLREYGLSPSKLLQEAIDSRMRGDYDPWIKSLKETLYERYKRYKGNRPPDKLLEWLSGEAWKPFIAEIGFTPSRFMEYCEKRLQLEEI